MKHSNFQSSLSKQEAEEGLLWILEPTTLWHPLWLPAFSKPSIGKPRHSLKETTSQGSPKPNLHWKTDPKAHNHCPYFLLKLLILLPQWSNAISHRQQCNPSLNIEEEEQGEGEVLPPNMKAEEKSLPLKPSAGHLQMAILPQGFMLLLRCKDLGEAFGWPYLQKPSASNKRASADGDLTSRLCAIVKMQGSGRSFWMTLLPSLARSMAS